MLYLFLFLATFIQKYANFAEYTLKRVVFIMKNTI